MPRNYRCPHCRNVQSAEPDPSRKLTLTCSACGGRFKIPAAAGRARQKTSHQQASVREQLERQVDAMRTQDQTDKLNRIIAEKRLGDYDILDELGRGGMGVVFKAHHRHLKRMVALKVVLPNADDQETMLKRFKREAALHARLSHPNIVHVYDSGVIDGLHYFAMDFVTGTQLTALIGSPEFRLEQRVSVIQQIADALDHAHASGVVHRDIKPDNLIVDGGWRGHLVDFGIAKPTDSEGVENLTRQGLAVGTPHYMAPEQFRPKLGSVGPQSDVYALGAVLYHCLAGRPPFEADTAHGVLIKAATQDATALDNVKSPSDEVINADLAAIVRRCMAKAQTDRYENARAMADDLSRYLNGEEVAARPLSGKERTRRLLNRHRAVVGLFAMVASVLVIIIAAFVSTLLGLRTSNEELEGRVSAAKAQVVTMAETADKPEITALAESATTTLDGTSDILTSSRKRVLLTAVVASMTAAFLVLLFGYLLVLRPLMAKPEHAQVAPDDIGATADEV